VCFARPGPSWLRRRPIAAALPPQRPSVLPQRTPPVAGEIRTLPLGHYRRPHPGALACYCPYRRTTTVFGSRGKFSAQLSNRRANRRGIIISRCEEKTYTSRITPVQFASPDRARPPGAILAGTLCPGVRVDHAAPGIGGAYSASQGEARAASRGVVRQHPCPMPCKFVGGSYVGWKVILRMVVAPLWQDGGPAGNVRGTRLTGTQRGTACLRSSGAAAVCSRIGST